MNRTQTERETDTRGDTPMKQQIAKPLILLEASTRIELVYTDLQSAASPLRQLAVLWCLLAITTGNGPCKGKAGWIRRTG